jgi:hypothetical protein
VIFTSNMGRVAVSVPGVTIDSKSWDKFEGAERSADTQNYPAGGMVPSIATGGVTKRGPATISRAWDDTLISSYLALEAAINSAVSVSLTPLSNAVTVAAGKPSGFNYTGVLKSVSRPNYDSTSSSIAMLEIVCELNEVIA